MVDTIAIKQATRVAIKENILYFFILLTKYASPFYAFIFVVISKRKVFFVFFYQNAIQLLETFNALTYSKKNKNMPQIARKRFTF